MPGAKGCPVPGVPAPALKSRAPFLFLLLAALALVPLVRAEGARGARRPAPAMVEASDRRAHVAELVDALNAVRLRHRLPPLQHHPQLDVSAQAHAEDMLRRNYFAHESPEGRSAPERVQRETPRLIACDIRENIYMVSTSAREPRSKRVADAYDGWMNSPGHRANIVNRTSTHVGFGVASRVVNGRRVEYVVQVFGVVLGEWQAAPSPTVTAGQVLTAQFIAPAQFFLASLDQPQRPFPDPSNRNKWFVGGTPMPLVRQGGVGVVRVPADVPSGRYEVRVTHETGPDPGYYRLFSVDVRAPRRP